MANTKLYDGKLSTPTLNVMRLSSALICGADIKYPQNSTLNEFFKLMTNKLPDPTVRPSLKYMSIGFAGHKAVKVKTIDSFVPVAKSPTASGMFSHVPFVLRTLDNDLSDEQRKNYAFRTQIEIDGRQYYAYYLKRLDMRAVTTTDLETVRTEGVTTTKDFTYTDSDLNPVQKDLPYYDFDDDSTVEQPDGRYVQSGCDIIINWSEFDIQEYLNVAAILLGDAGSAIVSEIALCSGVDTPNTGKSSTGTQFSYDEAIGVQVLYHISLFTNLAQTNDQLGLTIRVGQPVPFYLGQA